MTPDQTPTAAQALASRFETTYIRELSPGLFMEFRKPQLMAEILAGTLPNEYHRHVRYEDVPREFDERTEAERERDAFITYQAIIARSLTGIATGTPGQPPQRCQPARFKPANIKSGKSAASPAKNEIGPEHLTPTELANAYHYILREVVPPVASAPFPGDGADRSGPAAAAQPGDDLSPDAE